MKLKFNQKTLTAGLMAAGLLMAATGAHAGATLVNTAGTVALGVNNDGSLNTADGGVAANGGFSNIPTQSALETLGPSQK